jgi:hypothetical protein
MSVQLPHLPVRAIAAISDTCFLSAGWDSVIYAISRSEASHGSEWAISQQAGTPIFGAHRFTEEHAFRGGLIWGRGII